jgi:hypothetical protein
MVAPPTRLLASSSAILIALTIVSVWPLEEPVRGRLETILMVPVSPAAEGEAAGDGEGDGLGDAAGLAAVAGFGTAGDEAAAGEAAGLAAGAGAGAAGFVVGAAAGAGWQAASITLIAATNVASRRETEIRFINSSEHAAVVFRSRMIC